MATESNQSEETNNVNNVFGKYKDRFQGIEKLNGILVDLNVDPEFEPVAQPPRCQLFSKRGKYNISLIKTLLKKSASQHECDGCHHLWFPPRRVAAKYA